MFTSFHWLDIILLGVLISLGLICFFVWKDR